MRILLLLSLLFYSLILTSQETSPGFDPDYANALQTRLSEAASQKGISAAVFIPGQGIWVGTHGEGEENTPVTPDMRFGIASNSKALTAALIMVLQDEGLLDLDDEVGEYLPDYDHVDPDITIRQLLTHTSGLFDFINDWSIATQNEYIQNPNKTWSFDDLISTIGSSPIDPAERYDYSNTNFLLAGMIAEAVTGTPIHELFQDKLFDPLELKMAYPPADNIFAEPFANHWNGSSFSLSANNSNGFLSYPSTAGAIWSTAYDMVRWYDALFSGQLLSEASLQDMLDNDGHIPYAMGLRLETVYGHSFYYHGGAWGFRSYMLYNVERGISLCILSNDQSGSWVGNLAFELWEEVIDEMPQGTYDIALEELDTEGNICQLDDALKVEVLNKGTAAIDQFRLVYRIDENLVDSIEVALTEALAPEESRAFTFDLPSIEPHQKHRLDVHLKLLETETYTWDNGDYEEIYYTNGEGIDLPFEERMEETDNFPEQLISLNPNTLLDWKRTTFVAFEGEQSLARNNYVDQLYIANYAFELPMLYIENEQTFLDFAYAHTNVNSFQRDDLRVLISTDCGDSFQTLLSLIDNAFVTAPLTDIIYQAEMDDWEFASLDLSEYSGEHVIIRFILGNDYGNVAYLDDLHVRSIPVNTEELNPDNSVQLFPNPTRQKSLLQWPEDLDIDQIELVNTLGQTVLSIDVNGMQQYHLEKKELPAGTYFVNLLKDQESIQHTTLIFLSN